MKVRSFAVGVGLIGILSTVGAPVDAAGTHAGSILLDCNGYGLANNPDHPSWRCPDPRGGFEADERAFEDNGHYIGHDEPSLQFFSTTPGSGNSARYEMTVPADPAAAPNGTVAGPVWNFQTHIAPWFGMVMCDSDSFPETTKVCVPDSDTNNVPEVPTADHAGTAFMELQFYPPGYTPHISCDQVHWCVALTITSLQISFDNVRNNHCIEPQAFAFLTKSGHPIGPTGPDNSTPQSFKPTPDVLLLNRGDNITVSTYDTADGFVASITDHTTGQTGSMTAGASNGWRHIVWDPVNFNCKGEPYTVHPMFSTAAPPYASGQPRQWTMWTAHTWNVAMSDEIGHFEAPDETGIGRGKAEERPCYNNPFIRGCLGTDYDFDGYAYQSDWPDGDPNHPGPQTFSSPESLVSPGTWAPVATDIRFEANLPSLQPLSTCDFQGNGCTNPPPGANFYPWFHLVTDGGGCSWTLSNDLPGQLSNFGGEQQAWGPILFTDYGDGNGPIVENFASDVISNPCQ